ncbi:DoxX family protein [Saccharicrinis sp. FJH62]|uniref:DoxX family protein n=1 Tax=Saccharicrinis sp. FJH62 TaxID=3344657 RepID=UPI0035D40948
MQTKNKEQVMPIGRKTGRYIYWVATIFLSLGMLASGVQQLLQIGGFVDIFHQLGYPIYMMSILGFWKILGVIAILTPKYPLVKEWAYAGFFFIMTGAAASHLMIGQPFVEALPPLSLLIVTILSWYFRAPGKRIVKV